MFKKQLMQFSVLLAMLFLTALPLKKSIAMTEKQTVHPFPQSQMPIDAPTMQAFVDTYIADNMAAAHVPGLAIAVVKDGEIILAEGYGYADLAKQTPMTSQTSVRAGSISKPLLAAVVMQLVEQGLVDLDTPISHYITDLDLEDEYGPASTVGQLMTHMGGYDDVVLQTHAPTYADWQPLGSYLQNNAFPRSLPPGKVISYSSYGYALLGYAIEKAAGMSYEDIATRNLFAPLDMNMSTFAQPLPADIVNNLGTGYRYNNGKYQIVPHDFVKMSPGVALVTTADDMGKFILALLNRGVLNETRAMTPETADTLLERQVGISPHILGRSYAFWENSYAGRQVLTHEGNGIGFSNVIALAPEEHFGLYIVINHQVFDKGGTPSAAWDFVRSLRYDIVTEFLPAQEGHTLGKALANRQSEAAAYAGHYQPTNYSNSDFFKLAALTDAFDVQNNGDGTINIGSREYIEIEPRVVQSIEDPDRIWSFVANEQGEIEFLTFGRGATYRKTAWYENAQLHLALAALMVLSFLSMLIVWPLTRQGHGVVVLVSLINLIVLAGYLTFMFNGNIIIWYKTIPLGLSILQILPWVSGILSLGLIAFTVMIWQDSHASRWGRWHYALVTLTSFIFIWFTNFWNLLLK